LCFEADGRKNIFYKIVFLRAAFSASFDEEMNLGKVAFPDKNDTDRI
tara:strand:+ start:529 stop:669 length:141 start_codon:yes stop_codon:yes gene_type:complete